MGGKQVMQSHSKPPTSRPMPSQSPSNSYFGKSLLHFYCWAWHLWGTEYPPGQLGAPVLAAYPQPQSGQGGKQRRLWCRVRAVQQCPEHCCAIGTMLVTNLEVSKENELHPSQTWCNGETIHCGSGIDKTNKRTDNELCCMYVSK